MKKLVLTICTVALTIFTYAQTEEAESDLKAKTKVDTLGVWVNGGTFNTSFSNTGLSNWAGGGQNSISINSLLSLYANKKVNKISIENNLDLAFGLLKQGEGDFLKSDDKIELNTKIGKEINKKLYYAGLINFRSQFANGFDNVIEKNIISRFMSPGYLLVAAGIDYKPNKYFSAFIAPLTSKNTFVTDQILADSGAFGVLGIGDIDGNGNILTSGKRFRTEVGGYVKLAFKKDIVKNVTLDTRADFFSNYLKDPQYVDVNWQTLISMKVNKYISCTFSTHLIYDKDIEIEGRDRVQFKHVFGAGLAYKFSNLDKKKKKK